MSVKLDDKIKYCIADININKTTIAELRTEKDTRIDENKWQNFFDVIRELIIFHFKHLSDETNRELAELRKNWAKYEGQDLQTLQNVLQPHAKKIAEDLHVSEAEDSK